MEASVIIPMIVVITAALLMLLFFEHNRVWYLSAAAEMALCANSFQAEGADAPEDAAKALGQTRVKEQVMPGTSPSVQIQSSGSGSTVTADGQRFPVLADRFHWSVKIRVDKTDPVGTLRKLRAVRIAAEEG